MVDSVSHGYKRGDKLLVQCGFGNTVVTYLNYSEVNFDYFICELENGDISDEWKWDEIIRKLDPEEIKKHEELSGVKPETSDKDDKVFAVVKIDTEKMKEMIDETVKKIVAELDVIRCKDCKHFGKIGCAIMIHDDSDKPKEDDFCSFAERKETTDGQN